MEDIMVDLGISVEKLSTLQRVLMFCLVVAVAYLLEFFCRKVLIKTIRSVTARTETKWDDYILNTKVLNCACHLICPVIIFFFLPLILEQNPTLLFYVQKLITLYIIVICVMLVCALLGGFYAASAEEAGLQNHPLQGLAQMLKLIVIAIGVIIGISVLLDKNPIVILTGLGASAAVLMLVFKDTILGLVAGVQLSANKMLKVGDWIAIPSRNVNGVVYEVTLTTVKVRNYDNTIITVPPYSLVSESFQNWRGMWESGARRVMRSINIDMNTVRFCSAEDMARYEGEKWFEGIERSGEREVNLKIFRHYLEHYITNHPRVDKNTMIMIRQLQPTPQGLPVELYFFTETTEWKRYEYIQADIFDHAIAIINEFGLKVFQSPTGDDITSLKLTQR